MSTWTIDRSHSEINFRVKHMMISTVRGSFNSYDATIVSESEDFSDAKFTFTAYVDTINTNNDDRDAHLRSEDFFNAPVFPEITFVSKSFTGNKLVGDLTIKDTTNEITLNMDFQGVAVDPYGQTKAGFEASGKLNRKDFGLTWNAVTEAGKIVVSDTINLVIDLQFIKK